MKKQIITLFLAVAIGAVSSSNSVFAADKTWTGTGDGTNWSGVTNWNDSLAPLTGDSLTFNSTPSDLTINNDVTGLKLNNLTFSGNGNGTTLLQGASFRINGALTDQNTGDALTIVSNNMATDGATLKVYSQNNAGLALAGNLYMYSNNLGLRSYGDSVIFFSGKVYGSGYVVVAGDSTTGTYLTSTAQIIRPIIIKEQGTLLGSGKVGSITQKAGSYLLPDGCMNARNVKLDGYYYADIGGGRTCTDYSRLNAVGKVDVGGATLATKYSLRDGYVPAKGKKFILIANDGKDRVIGTFKYRPEGKVFSVAGGYKFKISYKGGSGNDVVLTRV